MLYHLSLYLEHHLVWPIALTQAEAAAEIAHQHRLLLDGGKQRLIHLLLVLHPRPLNLILLLLALAEELLLAALLILLLVPREVFCPADFLDRGLVDVLDVYGCLGGDDIAGVDSAEWDAVDFEWTGDQEDALVEDFEEDDTFASEATGEEDEDFAGREGGSWFVWSLRFAGLRKIISMCESSGDCQSQLYVTQWACDIHTFLFTASSSAG